MEKHHTPVLPSYLIVVFCTDAGETRHESSLSLQLLFFFHSFTVWRGCGAGTEQLHDPQDIQEISHSSARREKKNKLGSDLVIWPQVSFQFSRCLPQNRGHHRPCCVPPQEDTVEVTSSGVISNRSEPVQIRGPGRSTFCSGKPRPNQTQDTTEE